MCQCPCHRHYIDEGNDLISMNMVNFVLLEEVAKVISKVRRTPRLDYSSSYDEEIILEGLEADTSRISQRLLRSDETLVSCMPLRMEISLDGGFETFVNEKPLEEQADKPLKEINDVFYNDRDENELKQPEKSELSRTKM